MADSLRITCSCGCENRVPVERQGQTVICTACGNDLVAEEQTPSESNAIARPEVGHEALSPALMSPGMHQRSPFEVDPEQELSALDRVEAVRQNENRARRIFLETSTLKDGFTVELCSQCGKELRGDWDRIETDARIICYVCSNQGTHGLPERLRPQHANSAHSRHPHRTRRSIDSELPPSLLHPRWFRFKSVATKVMLFSLSFVVFTTAIYVFFFDSGQSTGSGFDTTQFSPSPSQLAKLPTGIQFLVDGWMIASVVLPVFIALYLVRFFNGSLPGRRFFANIGDVAVSCAPLSLIQLIAAGLDTAPGGELNLMSFFLGIAQLWALRNMFLVLFEEDVWQAIGFVLVLQAFTMLVVPYLNLLIFRSLGLI